MNNIAKSVSVLLLLVGLIVFSILLMRKGFNKNRHTSTSQKVIAICVCLCTLVCVVCFGKYTYPFERDVEMTLIATLTIPSENALDAPLFWRAVYEETIWHSGSRYLTFENKNYHLGFTWPNVDLENYSYIVTFGQEAESLTYNVWTTIDAPIRTGAYAGHMKFKDGFTPNVVYVYRIPKMRIDNGFYK